MDMTTLNVFAGGRIRRHQKNTQRTFLFLCKQKAGCLFSGTHNITRPKKMLRLCIRDEFGIRALAKPAVTLKSTTLRREIKLRTIRRNILWIYRTHNVHTWAEYKENTKILRALHRVINRAIEKYMDRRKQAGLFYLTKDDDFTYAIRSHLYGESNSQFLRDLWRRKKLERKMRETDQRVCNVPTSNAHGSSDLSSTNFGSIATRTMKLIGRTHVFCLLLVIFLAWAIVYM
ncbi:unnamed protein product [Alopecurus aequalis]